MEVVQQHKPNSSERKRKRKQKGVDDGVGINKLPADVVISILCRLSRKEAARTSVLARRWRYLWLFCSPGTLELDDRSMFSTLPFVRDDIANKYMFVQKKFIDWVNRLLKLYQDLSLDDLVIRFAHFPRPSLSGRRRPGYIDKWIYFAMQKKLKMLELNFAHNGCFHSSYEFPNLDVLLSHSTDANKFGFGSLRSLRLAGLDIKDDVVHYFLASCPFLEQLCIIHSRVTKNLNVVVPLKVLEISKCCSIQSLEISDDLSLSELSLDGTLSRSFIYEPKKHSTYTSHLVKLRLDIPCAVIFSHSRPGFLWRLDHYHLSILHKLCSLEHLELNVTAPVGRSLHFFTSLIKASPILKEFRIKLSYKRSKPASTDFGFPEVFSTLTSYQCLHENLKVVQISGYVGCHRHDEFVLRLLEISPSIEFFTIDTDSEYYELKPWVCSTSDDRCTKGRSGICVCTMQATGARTRMEAKERAERLKPRFPPRTVLAVM